MNRAVILAIFVLNGIQAFEMDESSGMFGVGKIFVLKHISGNCMYPAIDDHKGGAVLTMVSDLRCDGVYAWFTQTESGLLKNFITGFCVKPHNHNMANNEFLVLEHGCDDEKWRFTLTSEGSLKFVDGGLCVHTYHLPNNPPDFYKNASILYNTCGQPRIKFTVVEVPKMCQSFPCKNGGKCSEEGESYLCTCAEHFDGVNCEESKPIPCDSTPCKNEGKCSNEEGSFTCECTEQFEGKTCEKESKPKPCDSTPCKNEGKCSNEGGSFTCECTEQFEGKTCEKEAGCKLDLLYIVDGSVSVRIRRFGLFKKFLKRLNQEFNIGPDKTHIALIQMGEPSKTKIEFNLGQKDTLENVNQGVDDMKYLRSESAAGYALEMARLKVFNGEDGDRPDVPNVLILFAEGKATDKGGEDVQMEEAKKLRDNGVKIITVAMGTPKSVVKFNEKLQEVASKSSETDKPLHNKTRYVKLRSIEKDLVVEACG